MRSETPSQGRAERFTAGHSAQAHKDAGDASAFGYDPNADAECSLVASEIDENQHSDQCRKRPPIMHQRNKVDKSQRQTPFLPADAVRQAVG
jgi:hypothetical protein